MSKRSKYFYGILRIAAAFRKGIDEGLEEVRRFNYVYSKEDCHLRKGFNIWTFYPEGISCQIRGVTHYTPRNADKPSAPQFHNLQKHGQENED